MNDARKSRSEAKVFNEIDNAYPKRRPTAKCLECHFQSIYLALMFNKRWHIPCGRVGEDSCPTSLRSAKRGRFGRGIALVLVAILLLPMMVAAAVVAHSCAQPASLVDNTGQASAGMSLQAGDDPSENDSLDGARGACVTSCSGMVLPETVPKVPATPVGRVALSAASHSASQPAPPNLRPPRHLA